MSRTPKKNGVATSKEEAGSQNKESYQDTPTRQSGEKKTSSNSSKKSTGKTGTHTEASLEQPQKMMSHFEVQNAMSVATTGKPMEVPEPVFFKQERTTGDAGEQSGQQPTHNTTPVFGILHRKVKQAGRMPAEHLLSIDLDEVYRLAAIGLTQEQIAQTLRFSLTFLRTLANEYEEFATALQAGQSAGLNKVRRSLYARATGFTVTVKKAFAFQGKVVQGVTEEYIPPSEKAGIFILTNRDPENWKNKVQVESEQSNLDSMPMQEVEERIQRLQKKTGTE